MKNFEYHCAHSFFAYAEVTRAIFGAQGEKIVSNVLESIAKDYSQEMADTLMKYKDTNFNVCE